MPVAKLKANGTPDAGRSEGNESLDNFIRQTIGKETLHSFSRTGDSPVQWIQLLNALDQQGTNKYLPGWPLLSPLKVQMQKCDKCPQEFCSPINHRRHVRVHRRSWKADKDSTVKRDVLGVFWDKLSLDAAKEIVSLNDVMLKEITGSSIIRALTSCIRKPGFSSLPQICVEAGSALLDIVQSRPTRFPVPAQELFSILDDASERTFLCTGTAQSVEKYVFDGEAGKIGLEMKNLVACTSFLLEQKLIQAWLADQEAEALRCQNLLMEEEDAAQRRKVELLEKKRQKKLRQKEQKVKEQQMNSENTDSKEDIVNTIEVVVPSAETSIPMTISDSESHTPEADLVPLVQLSNTEEDADAEAQSGFSSGYSDSGTCQNLDRRSVQGSSRRQPGHRWQVQKSRGVQNGFHNSQNVQVPKPGPNQKHGNHKNPKVLSMVNGNKVWTRKSKSEKEGESLKPVVQKEVVAQTQPNKNEKYEVLIGSIPVMLGNCNPVGPIVTKNSYIEEKPNKPESVACSTSRSMVKLWRPVSRHENRDAVPVQSGNGESDLEVVGGEGHDPSHRTPSCGSCVTSCGIDDRNGGGSISPSSLDEGAELRQFQFSSDDAKAFLAQRWKEAIACDHVTLVLSLESDPPGCDGTEAEGEVEKPASDSHHRNTENQGTVVIPESSSMATTTTTMTKLRLKPEKVKLKYIPKQRTII